MHASALSTPSVGALSSRASTAKRIVRTDVRAPAGPARGSAVVTHAGLFDKLK